MIKKISGIHVVRTVPQVRTERKKARIRAKPKKRTARKRDIERFMKENGLI